MHISNPIPKDWRWVDEDQFAARLLSEEDYVRDAYSNVIYYVNRRTKERFAAVLNDHSCWVKG